MKTVRYIWTLCLALAACTFTACSDDDDNGAGASMTVEKVFLENASSTVTNHDREIDFARLGQMIRIQGKGFSGLKKIYINGYDTYFNNALMTDNNVWVTLNSKTPVEKADHEVRNKIRLYKNDNNYVDYELVIRAAAPTVSEISITLPQPGETVIVYGANLQETTKITLPSGTEITNGIMSDPDGEWYSFVMPEGESASGSIISEGANGIAKSPACFNERGGIILDFDGNGVMGGWSVTYKAEDLVADPLNSGRGTVVPLFPESVLNDGGIAAGAHGNGWFTAGNDEPMDEWSRFYSLIPEDTPVEKVALQFDVYCPQEWNGTGMIEFTFQNNLSTYGYGSTETQNTKNIEYPTAVVWIPWLDTETGKTKAFRTDGWQTVTIPISKVGKYQAGGFTFADVVADRNAGSYRNFGMFFVNTDIELNEETIFPASRFAQPVYVDNWRIVPYETFTISDFDD